jgi:hypothetical protein
MRYTEDSPPTCKCGLKMRLYQEPAIVPSFYWACAKRGIFNFWRHTARFASEYGYLDIFSSDMLTELAHEKNSVHGPFLIAEDIQEVGFRDASLSRDLGNVRRVAIVDQTPRRNIAAFVLPEFAEAVLATLNSASGNEPAPPLADALPDDHGVLEQ